tara:strand:+ start:34737 stop:35069 length:333 start_codon:yes stop_codon:yes gene_type:complete
MSKFLQLIEVYEVTEPTVYGRTPGISQTILEVKTTYALRSVLVNIDHVTLLREDACMKDHQELGKLPEGLDERTLFTRLYVACGSSSSAGIRAITVVGDLKTLTNLVLAQ